MKILEKKELVVTDHNGTEHWESILECPRCGGAKVIEVFKHNEDGGICFKCNGAGTIEKIVKVYTAEHQARLDKQKEYREKKKIEKAKQEQEKRDAEYKKEQEILAAKEVERLNQAAISDFVGSVGEVLESEVTCTFRTDFETADFSGYGITTFWIYKMIDQNDNVIVVKTTGKFHVEENETIIVKGRIKEHSVYNEEKQTILQRARIIQHKEKVT